MLVLEFYIISEVLSGKPLIQYLSFFNMAKIETFFPSEWNQTLGTGTLYPLNRHLKPISY